MTNEDDKNERDRRRHHQIGMLAIYLWMTLLAAGFIIAAELVGYIVALLRSAM